MKTPPPLPDNAGGEATPYTQDLKPGQLWVRASFWTRLASICLDIAVVTLALSAVKSSGGQILFIAVLLYFAVCDIFLGRSIGKWLMGLHYRNKDGSAPVRGKIIGRSFFRLLGPLAVLSWRRTTITDLISGTRVFQVQYPKKKKREKGPLHYRTFEPTR